MRFLIREHEQFVITLLMIGIYALVQFTAAYFPSPGIDLISARVQDVIMIIAGYYFGSSHSQPKTRS